MPLLIALLLATIPVVDALSEEMQSILDQHNIYRCMHGVTKFTWSSTIADKAQEWADNGEYKHSTSTFRTYDGQYHGENLAMGSPSISTGARTAFQWYAEISETDPYGIVTSFSGVTGHYTQVVWAASTSLGCGKGKVGALTFWVCQYGPGGNYGGEYSANVNAPSKTACECGGTADDVRGSGCDASAYASGALQSGASILPLAIVAVSSAAAALLLQL